MASGLKPTVGLLGEFNLQESLKKHSILLNDSESENEDNIITATSNVGVTTNEFFDSFQNKYVNKDTGFRLQRLKAYREDGHMQSLARAVFDFSMDDKARFELLFETEGNLKLIWHFIFLSFMDQELLMLELKYKQHAEDFNRIHAVQVETGKIAKKDGPKVYRLFKLFCLKDRVFNAFINRPKKCSPISTETVVETEQTRAMDIETDLKLPSYTDTEIMMDDCSLSMIEFMSRFEKFKVDEVSIGEAEDDICFNAKEAFEDSSIVSLIGLRYTEDENTNDWEKRKLDYSPASPLPLDFQELLNSDYGNKCAFLFAMHPENVNKEILAVIDSAHIFVDKKALRQKLNAHLQQWFFNPSAFIKQAERKQDDLTKAAKIEPGFVDKLMEMFKYRRILKDLKRDIEQNNGLSNGYARTEGKFILDVMITFRSTYMQKVFSKRSKDLDENFQRMINKARFENYTAAYNALRCQCETEYDIFMNVTLWNDILEQFCDRTHSQYGMVAIIRACMVIVNKEIWKAFLEFRSKFLAKESLKRKNRELQEEANFKKRQMSTREQCIDMIGEEFTKKWEALPSNVKTLLAGMPKEDFDKQPSTQKKFSSNSFMTTPIKGNQLKKHPAIHSSKSNQSSSINSESPAIQPMALTKEISQGKPTFIKTKNKGKIFFNSANRSNQHQQTQFFKKMGPSNSRRPAFKSGGEVDPYSPDFAPMNIFENQVIPIGIHNLSKIFRPNLATIRVLSLGMKFIPKTESLKWKNVFSNFEDFRRRMNNKMFFFVEKSPGTFVRDKTFRIKSSWNCMEEYNDVNKFCFNVRDRLDIVFQKNLGTKRSQNMSNKEKTALKVLQQNKNVSVVINDTDKNVGPACADKEDVIKESRRQLHEKRVYNQLTQEEADQLIRVIKKRLSTIVNKHTLKGVCSKKEAAFLLSNLNKFKIPHFYIMWKILKNPIVGRPIVAGYNWILTPASIYVGHYLKNFCRKFDSILLDSISLVKILEKERFDSDCFLFTVDFESLYTNIPVQHAIELMKELVFEYKTEISNADFIIDLLEIVLENSLMEFHGEYFQQIFGIIMGTNVAPIIANLYLAKLEKILKEKSKGDPNMVWPIFFKRYIDDGFGITKGSKSNVEYWILEFNKLVKSIKIDKFKYGPRVEYMDLIIFKGNRFSQSGLFDIKIFQKPQNLYAYIPQKSNHKKHTIKNFVVNELKRYVKFNSEKLWFLKLRNKFFDRLRNRGFNTLSLNKFFALVSYASRDKYLYNNDNIYSNVIQETEAEKALEELAEETFQDHLASSIPNQTEEDPRGIVKIGTILPKDKVGFFDHLTEPQNKKPTKDYSLGCIFPGECYGFRKDIQDIFKEELEQACQRSSIFQQCFAEVKVGAIFRNEKKLRALVSKSKL